jgi:aryl-alcohol dehydrogenase-like predicted oxidoreductase
MTHLALAWLLSRPGVTSAIVGSRSAQEALSNAAAADVSLGEDILASLTDATNGLKERFGSGNPDMWQLPDRMR